MKTSAVERTNLSWNKCLKWRNKQHCTAINKVFIWHWPWNLTHRCTTRLCCTNAPEDKCKNSKTRGKAVLVFWSFSLQHVLYVPKTNSNDEEKNCLANMGYHCQDNAWPWTALLLGMMIKSFEALLQIFVPCLAQSTVYRTSPTGQKRKRILLKELTTWRDPFLLLVVPTTKGGVCTHSYWMVDDLILDTLNGHALKQIWATVEHLRENDDVTIYPRHYKEPIKHVELRTGHRPYSKKVQQNFETELDEPLVEYKKKPGKKQ